jgi:hypothetical protein
MLKNLSARGLESVALSPLGTSAEVFTAAAVPQMRPDPF